MVDDTVVNMATLNRPKTFSAMVGQPFATGVGTMLGKGKVSGQGYILSGPRGCGKTSMARIIAMSLNCENRDSETGDPCLECPSCRAALNFHHPRIEEINAASNRGINDIKEKLSSLNLAVPSGYRVFIFDEVHMLTKDAFSVLLKPIEEPPENVVFIFTTTNPEAIPDTILSRAPIIPILPMTDDELTGILRGVVESGMESEPEIWAQVSDSDIAVAVSSASGSARQAITNLSGCVFHGVGNETLLSDVDSIVEGFVSRDVSAVLSSALAALSSKKSDPLTIITSVMDGLLNATTAHSGGSWAREIANLSVVASEVSMSSPSMMVASRIASCVVENSPVPSVELLNEDNRVNTPQKDFNGSQGVPESTESSPRVMKIHRGTDVDDVIFHILDPSNLSLLGKSDYTMLDDPTRSEFVIKGGTLVISVDQPSEKLSDSLRELVDNFQVRTLGGKLPRTPYGTIIP